MKQTGSYFRVKMSRLGRFSFSVDEPLADVHRYVTAHYFLHCARFTALFP